MNTRASVAYGWGVLCLAGGGAYYFAKRSINSDRAERAQAEENRRQQRERLRIVEAESRNAHLNTSSVSSKQPAKKRAPNAEKPQSNDPAPIEHEEGSKNGVEPTPLDSKYAARDPFRSRKGDRFS